MIFFHDILIYSDAPVYIYTYIKYYLNCVPKMKEGLTGLEQHEGE